MANKKKEKKILQIPEGQLDFLELISKIKEVESKLITKEDFWNYVYENLEICSVVTSETQYFCIENIFIGNPMLSQESSIDRTKQIELCKIYDILLSGYTNLYINLSDRSFTNYDYIVNSGVENHILGQCQKDYNKYCKRFDEALGQEAVNLTLKTLNTLTEVLENLGSDIQKSTEGFQKGLEELTPEMLERVQNLTEFNDPINKQVTEFIKSESAKDMRKDKEELLKQLEELKSIPFNEAFNKNPELVKQALDGIKINKEPKDFIKSNKK